jgi:hypothetical protein
MEKTCDICFSFDTTGSMAPCLAEVRRNLGNIIPRLFRDIPNLRMSIVAHGDYCDEKTTYLMKHIDFTADMHALAEFVNGVGNTSGGDFPEAYEYVLNKVQGLDWRSNDTRCLVMLGDAYPHEKKENPFHLDWREELVKLDTMGVNIYSIQCLNSGSRVSHNFYKTMADKTNGYHLNLDQFAYVTDMILGVAYKQVNPAALEAYQQEVADRLGGMDLQMRAIFDRLTGKQNRHEEYDEGAFERKYDVAGGDDDDGKDLRPVPPARFQILNVDQDCKISDFVRRMGLNFAKGRGFYEFTKSEEIGSAKQVVLRRKATGELFQGKKARRLAKIADEKVRMKPKDVPDYDIFIQSTSYTRKLLAGTRFLYEVPRA